MIFQVTHQNNKKDPKKDALNYSLKVLFSLFLADLNPNQCTFFKVIFIHSKVGMQVQKFFFPMVHISHSTTVLFVWFLRHGLKYLL